MHVKGNRHTRDKHILSLSLQLSKILGRVVRGLIESSKPFVRWMDGTCIEAPEQRSAQVGIMFYTFSISLALRKSGPEPKGSQRRANAAMVMG